MYKEKAKFLALRLKKLNLMKVLRQELLCIELEAI